MDKYRNNWRMYAESMPSRICLICKKLEFPNAELLTEIGWICPECTKRIKQMINLDGDR